MELNRLPAAVPALDTGAAARAKANWDAIAKPLNGLGLLEEAIVRIAAMTGDAEVRLDRRRVLTFCADNGVVKEGVTQTGPEVTAIVAGNIAAGRATVSAMSRVAGCEARAVDVGMFAPSDNPSVIDRRVMPGTHNIAEGPAMSRMQAAQAVCAGAELAMQAAREGVDILLTGEMGIGNTTTAAALAAALLGVEPESLVGRGAGLSDDGLARKRCVVCRALRVNRALLTDPLGMLAALGGLDIAGMAGAFLGGAFARVPVLADGVISLVAALVAERLRPGARGYMLASHISREPAARLILDELELKPVICAQMALGEGTGAVAMLPLLDMALSVYRQRSTFDQIGVTAYVPLGGESEARK